MLLQHSLCGSKRPKEILLAVLQMSLVMAVFFLVFDYVHGIKVWWTGFVRISRQVRIALWLLSRFVLIGSSLLLDVINVVWMYKIVNGIKKVLQQKFKEVAWKFQGKNVKAAWRDDVTWSVVTSRNVMTLGDRDGVTVCDLVRFFGSSSLISTWYYSVGRSLYFTQ